MFFSTFTFYGILKRYLFFLVSLLTKSPYVVKWYCHLAWQSRLWPACLQNINSDKKFEVIGMKAKGYSTIAGLENATSDEIKNRNMEHYGSKIKKFRKKAGMSAEQLADELQISKSSVRNWECGLTRPDPEFLYRMFSILDVEPNEFFGFKGIGSLLTTAEKNLIDDYRRLDRRGKEDLSSIAESMAEKRHIRLLRDKYNLLNCIPFNDRSVAAGSIGEDWPDHPDTVDIILFDSREVSSADEIFMVSGDSMNPQFFNGDRVLVQYTEEIRVGDIGIFYVPGVGGVIKQKMNDRLHSLNPDYDDIIVHEEGAKPIGRVLCKIEPGMIPDIEDQNLFLEAMELKREQPEIFNEVEV